MDAVKVPTRPMGQPGSPNWTAMIDAAEDILREEGFRALTSRRIAEKVGFKQRLVYYYFRTMDDLVVEAFRRVSLRELARLGEAVHAEHPFQEIWDVSVHTLDPRLISEFMALANRIEALRTEVIHFIAESRRLQVQVISKALEQRPDLSELKPKALAMLGSSVALNILREQDLGIDLGHSGVLKLIAGFLARADSATSEENSM